MQQTVQIKSKIKRANGIKPNGKSHLSLDELTFPSYEQIKAEIEEKIGKMPVKPKDLKKGGWTEQSLKVLEERYLVKNSKGKAVEAPEQMVWRVSWEIASAEARRGANKKTGRATAGRVYNLLVSKEFLPNSPTLMNAGTG